MKGYLLKNGQGFSSTLSLSPADQVLSLHGVRPQKVLFAVTL
jgi:hypothetical protein